MIKSMLLSLAASSLIFGGSALAETVKVNSTKSKVEWMGKKVVGGSHNGTISVKSGELVFDGKNFKSGNVVIDMKSIKNEDLKDAKWNKKLVGHLASDDFFDVANHATSKLVIKSLKKSGSDYVLKGDLTIRGVTKPVQTNAKLTRSGDGVVLKADLIVDRTLFNVKYGSGKFFKNLGDKMIADQFEIKATIVADPAGKKQSSL